VLLRWSGDFSATDIQRVNSWLVAPALASKRAEKP
jgi:outer membrane protein